MGIERRRLRIGFHLTKLYALTLLATLGGSGCCGTQIGRRCPYYLKWSKKSMSQLRCILLTLPGYFLQFMLVLDWPKGVSCGIIFLL